MNLTESIKSNLNKGFFNKSMRVEELPDEFPAWTLKSTDGWYGIAIPMETYTEFVETFSKVKIESFQNMLLDGKRCNALLLTCDEISLRNSFSTVCADFADPGDNGEKRKLITGNPEKWWREWKNLIGNKSSYKEPYDVLGEMIMLEKLMSEGKNPVWRGIRGGTHDIETESASVEVKSTISRYGYEVTISSINQLQSDQDKQLFLAFFRFEKSNHGYCVDDVASRLVALGFDHDELEEELKKLHLEPGRIARNERFKILEWRVYEVNESFPSLRKSDFIYGDLPQGVIQIKYTLDISWPQCEIYDYE